MSHLWPTVHTVTTYYKIEVNTYKVKLDKQHLHPYLAEMIKNTGLFR